MPILVCDRVNKYFGAISAVSDLSFEVEKGHIFGIAGPNGAGKSTLFNVITGFYSNSGDIYFEDINITRMKPYHICQLGIARTFQVPQLFESLSLLDNVKAGAHFGTKETHNNEKIISEVIKFVDLEDKKNALVGNLSLFDKKMTMIATALATKPKLLMLDEPTGGLSPAEVKMSIELFRNINNQMGTTLIIIEHVMKVLTELSNFIMIIHMGHKICVGPPHEVTKDPNVIKIYLGA